ncbi:MAG: AmmeMemoRadiSam system protein A [Clostridia bacterium]|nr:AmmeMemoRadiSam system protein A [Clostridiales bacterium]
MGKIGTSYLVPHPPIIVAEVGQGEERKAQKTIDAMKEVSLDIAAKKPEILVVITPHGPLFRDAMAVGVQREFSGDFGGFGQPGVSLSFTGHTQMAFDIMEEAARDGISVMAVDEETRKRYGISSGLDHGALVPLYFISKKHQGFGLVHITYGLLPPERLYRFGKCIQRAAEKQNGQTAVLCSGDLSHRLKRGAPAGYSKKGIEYDRKLVALLKDMRVEGIMKMDPGLIEQAGECAYRSVVTTLGVLDGYSVDARVLSYEGPYGVGYCVAAFTPSGREHKGEGEKPQDSANKSPAEGQRGDPFVGLARLALESYIKKGEVITPDEGLPEEMLFQRAGTFVSLKMDGQLRGCIGTIASTTENIAREIISNAISAGVRDPRFYPVTPEELEHLEYSVDVLGQPEVIQSMDELDVKRYGVIVRSGGRSGLLLPDIEGIDTPQQQVTVALRKAGISPGEPYVMERFEVIRHK